MQTPIFFAPDLHKRDLDFSSIRGFIDATEKVQQDLIHILESYENPIFVQMGDWYDKGYRSTGRTFVDSYYDSKIAEAATGGAYICLGNHFFIERDANPEMYIIQPSYLYKPRMAVPMDKPIFKTEMYITVGNVQISFFHYHKTDKNYVMPLQPGMKFHIGVYHDDCVLPSDIRSKAGYFGSTSNDYLNNIYSNVDIAICGHIHTKIGTTIYTLNNGKTVPIIVPGALAITENKEIVKHTSVDCPVIWVDDETGTFELKYETVSTHMDLLKFYKIAEQKTADQLEAMGTGESKLVTPSTLSVKDFLQSKGYPRQDIDFIMSIQPGSLDVLSIMQHIAKEDD